MNRDRPKLRVGLMLDSYAIPAWYLRMLERIQASDYATVELVILNSLGSGPKSSLSQRILRNLPIFLFRAHRVFETVVSKPTPNAFTERDASEILATVPALTVTPKKTKFSDRFEDQDIEKIQSYNLDVIIRDGFRILRGKVLQTPRYGVWSYHHGDNLVNRGGPAGFWEVMEGHPTTGSVLQILSEDLDNGLVLYHSLSATDPVLVNRNRNQYYWKTLSFIPRKLKELYDLGGEEFMRRARAQNNQISFYSHRLYTQPRNSELVVPLARHLLRLVFRQVYNWCIVNQWHLLFDLRDGLSTSLWRFRELMPPRDRYWADPHVLSKDGKYYIFFEEYVFRKGKGHITLLVMDEQGNLQLRGKVLERPYHLSYPFVFEWGGNYYMIPESAENRAIELYKCIVFPHTWEFCRTLMSNVKAVDTTLLYHQQKWWLFTNIQENPGSSFNDELFLFSADNPLSESWTPHPCNPIISDVRRARPAGAIFEHHGILYRPSQDCSKCYGKAVGINQIVKLNEREYEEREVTTIEPLWDKDISKIHTLNHVGRLTVADGFQWRSRFITWLVGCFRSGNA